MSSKTKPIKLALAATIIAVILIGFYAFVEQEASQSQAASQQQSEQTQMLGKDPFKEFLDKQQQLGGSNQQPQLSPSQPNQPMQPSGGIPAASTTGTDPFKAFLDAQAKSQKETSGASPFASGK